jgi:ferric-dicitrate binding protein FerR (iron transport regulator)
VTTSPTSANGELIDAARFERACEWFLELREEAQSPEVVAEWLEWCRADPLNREAFARARSVWQATGEVRAEDLELPSFALPTVGASETTRASRGHWRQFAIGGLLVAGVAAVALNLSPPAFLARIVSRVSRTARRSCSAATHAY